MTKFLESQNIQSESQQINEIPVDFADRPVCAAGTQRRDSGNARHFDMRLAPEDRQETF